MRISTKNLDSGVESAFWAAYVASQTFQTPGGQNPVWRHAGAWWKSYGGEVKRGLGAMALACGGLFGAAAATGSPVLDWAFGAALAGSGGVSLWWFLRNMHTLDAAELRVFLPAMELSRAERLYGDCVLMLMESDATYGERAARETIKQLNSLLATNRQLEEQRAGLVAALGRMLVEEADQERDQIAGRLSKASDEIEREALRQSLALCESRLENGRALLPGLRRIEAQQEVVIQTLLAVQSSLARLQIAPKAAGTPEIDEVSRTVAGITAQTRGVEDAVAEVLTVRSG
jgi:hypothetical protein